MEEEGEDQVMLEGFLESVKSLIDVNLETPAYNAVRYLNSGVGYNLAAEVNERYLQENQPADSTVELHGQNQDKEAGSSTLRPDNIRTSFLEVLGSKFKNLFRRMKGFMPRKKQGIVN
jgi:hypothetical protein